MIDWVLIDQGLLTQPIGTQPVAQLWLCDYVNKSQPVKSSTQYVTFPLGLHFIV